MESIHAQPFDHQASAAKTSVHALDALVPGKPRQSFNVTLDEETVKAAYRARQRGVSWSAIRDALGLQVKPNYLGAIVHTHALRYGIPVFKAPLTTLKRKVA
jgi:hypothetical protein